MSEGSRLRHEIMLHVEQLVEEGDNFQATELFQKVDKIDTERVKQEMSTAEYVVVFEDILAEIAFKESKEEACVFACKESNEVRKTGGKSVGDVEKEDCVFSRKESKDIIEDNFVRGREEAKKLEKDEEKEIKAIVEAVRVEQLIVRESFTQVKKVFRSLEQSFADLEKVDEEIFRESEEKEVEDFLEAPKEDCSTVGVDEGGNGDVEGEEIVKKEVVCEVCEEKSNVEKIRMAEDCSTVGVQEDSNVCGQDGEDVKPEVVREASRKEVLEAEDTIEKIKKAAAVKETFERFETAEVVHGECKRIDETAKAKAVNVAKVAGDKKEFSNMTEFVENCKDSREPSNDSKCFANLFNFNIPARSYAKFEYDKVKADEIDAKYTGECVKVTDAKKAGNPVDDRENEEAGIDVSRAVRCKADDVKPVSPVFESALQIVKKVEARVFAAESDVSKPAVGVGLMSSQKYGAGGHEYSQICEVDSGMGAGDLKQLERLGVVERSSLLEQLLADVSRVEEPDGLTLAMDPVCTKRYKSDKHMYRKKCRVDSGQGAKVFEQPGRLEIAERDGPSQRSFVYVSWVEEPSKLGRQDVQLAGTIYDKNQAGMVQEESKDS